MALFDAARQYFKSLNPVFIGVLSAVIVSKAVIDVIFMLQYGYLNLSLHCFLSLIILCIATTEISENFPVKSMLISTPNLVVVFLLAARLSIFGQFIWAMILQAGICALAYLQNQRLNNSFIHEGVFARIKQELKETRHESFRRLLLFSLVGCMKEKGRVISQAQHVLEEVFKVDNAVIFLADYQNNQLVPFTGDLIKTPATPIIVATDFWTKNALDPEKGVLNVISGRSSLMSLRQLIPGANLEALAVMPLSAAGKVIGLLAITKQKPENRAYLEPELFITFASVLASAIDNCSVHEMRISQLDSAQKIEQSFGKYVSPAIVKELVKDETLAVLGGKKRNVAIMMVDLRGFTALTGVLSLEYLVQLLNGWFEEASNLILKNHGTIDKYMGDGIMVIFGAPVAKPDDLLRSIHTAFRLQDKFYLFQKNLNIPQGYTLGLGISVTYGEAVVGNFGSSFRMEYTAIGEVVNLAARLEKLAGPGEIVIDEASHAQLPPERFMCTVEKDVKIKGVADQTIYRLTEIVHEKPTL